MSLIEQLNESMSLQITKVKDVKTPSKAWSAAGIDFYIPENLTIFDFAKDTNTFVSDSIVFDKSFIFTVPYVFYLTSKVTVGEYACQLVLKWNATANEWSFQISEYNEAQGSTNTLFNISKPEDKISKWLVDAGTVISRIKLLPQGRILIPSGIHMKLPENVFLKFDNKSGIASKRGLIVGSCSIDTDYQGEVHISLINSSNLPVILKAGEKIVQALPLFQPKMNEIVEISTLAELYKDTKSERGAGGFGSSGN